MIETEADNEAALATIELLMRKGDDGRTQDEEALEGELVGVSSPTPHHQEIVLIIVFALRQYLASGKGTALQDVEFAPSDLLRLRPDVCVLLAKKAQELNRHRIPVPGAPDIAIEVISSTERAGESHDKIRAYLQNGVTEAWQVFPKSQTVEVHRGTTSITLDSTQSILSDLLPGLQIPIASFFV